MPRNTDKYIYRKHPVLELDYAVPKAGEQTVYVENRDEKFPVTIYTESEQKILLKKGGITKEIHRFKKIFEGEIIE